MYRVFGTGTAAEIATYVIDLAAASATYALLPFVCVFLGLPKRAGILAAIVGGVVPVYLLNEFRSTTAVFGSLSLELLCLITACIWNTRRRLSARLGALCGAALGLALLISPNLLTTALAWLAVGAYFYRQGMIRFTAALFAIACAVMLPWAIRNQVVLGSPVFLRSNFGLELQIANNDFAGVSYAENSRSFARYQPFVNSEESEKVRRLGEAGYMRQKLAQALGWIAGHPRRFASLTGTRMFRFWMPQTYRAAQTAVLWTLTLWAFIGLRFTWHRQRPAFWILGSILLAYPAVYYFVQLDNPYRYPMYWSLLLLAAYGSTEAIVSLNVPRRFRSLGMAGRP